MIVNITGVFYLPSGVVAASRMVAFKPIDRTVRAGYLGGLVPDPVIIQTGIDGSVDFNLITGSYFVTIEAKDTDNIGRGLIFAGKANVPDAPSASISEILGAAVAPDVPPVWYTQAIQAAEDAIDAAKRAEGAAPFPDRAAAEAAHVPAEVTIINVDGLQYRREPGATDLVTADGATWKQIDRKNTFDATRAPLPTDDETQGYAPGSRWLWQGREWVAAGVAAGAAEWAKVSVHVMDSLPELLASSRQFPVGSIVSTSAEGFRYEVAASAPDLTTAGGAMLRVLPGEAGYNVRAFGAVGDDVTDDYPAFQAALSRVSLETGKTAAYNSVNVFIPEGVYRMSKKAVCAVASAGTPDLGTPGVNIRGAGRNATYLVASPSNTEGLIELTSDKNSEIWTVEGIGFLSDLPKDAATNNGVALEIKSTLQYDAHGFGSHPCRSAIVRDCFFGGYGTDVVKRAFGGNFATQLRIAYKWWPAVSDCWFQGSDFPFDADTNAPLYAMTGRDYAIQFKGCYSPEVGTSYVSGYFLNGIHIDGKDAGTATSEDYEDFRIFDSFVVGPDRAISVVHAEDQASRALYEPGGAITGCHINGHSFGIHVRYHRQIVISNNYFYVPRGRGLPNFTGLPASIWLQGADDIVITGCEFLEPGFNVDDDNASVAVRASLRANANIVGCLFNHGGIGIHVAAGTGGAVTVDAAVIEGQKSAVWATFKKYVDLSGIIFWHDTSRGVGPITVTQEVTGTSAADHIRHRRVVSQPNYATVSNPQLFLERTEGRNSNGAVVTAVQTRHDLVSNLAGAETAAIRWFLAREGALAEQLMSLDATDGRLNVRQGYRTGSAIGVSGTYTSQDGKTITVTGGIITGIA